LPVVASSLSPSPPPFSPPPSCKTLNLTLLIHPHVTLQCHSRPTAWPHLYSAMASPATTPTVLITGCSDGGLGAALAEAFARRGFHVLATLRDPSKAPVLASRPGLIDVLPLDVTDTTSIASCAVAVATKTGGLLDVLVNNAGSMFIMPLLDTDVAESKRLFDVNVWGMLAVTQAFASMLVRSRGVVLNIASIAGAVRMAWQGALRSIIPPRVPDRLPELPSPPL